MAYQPASTQPPQALAEGTPSVVVGSRADITTRKQQETEAALREKTEEFEQALQASELALRAREQEFRLLADSIPQLVWMCRPDGASTYFNQRWIEYTGLAPEECRTHGWNHPFHPDDQARAWEAWKQATLDGGTCDLECQLRRADGTYRWFIIRGLPLRDTEGRIIQWLSTCTDIHDRRQSEEALRLSEEKFAIAFANNPAAIALTRLEDGVVLDVNETWSHLVGYSRDEALGRSARDMGIWPNPADVRRFVGELREKGSIRGWEAAFRSKSGRLFYAQVSAEVLTIAGERVILSTLLDTTERRKAEAALRTSEERLRFALETSHTGGWELDLTDHSAFRTREHDQIFGYADLLPNWSYEQFLEHVLPEDRTEVNRRFLEATAHRTDWSFECRIRRVDGEVRWIWAAGGHQLDENGNPRRLAGIVQDITERVRVREALRVSEQRLGLASRSAGLGVWDWDLVNNRLDWDDQMFRIYGITEKPPSGGVDIWEQAVLPADLPRAKADSQAALRGERDYVSEFRIRLPGGAVRHIQAHGLVLRDRSGRPVRMLGVNADITDRKLLEDQLRQSQKLESIGQLAGGVAHDFNNILAATMLHLSQLQQNPHLDAPTRQALGELMTEAQRGANLTRQLLMFGRRSHLEVRTLDLNEVVGNLLGMLGRLIGENISIQFTRRADLPGVEADPTMIEQVLVNLCVNARDAMPRGGTLAIGLDAFEIEPASARLLPGSRPGRFVRLSVTDTGCGMDETVLQHVFEPFFTTKEVGKGTGLGLATVHGIVGQHRGWVEVTSQVGQGTTFRVLLPAVAPAAASLPAAPPKPEVLRGSETILLVEDEPTVRRIMAQTLRLLGYHLHEAESAPHALEIWNQHRDEIDLLFTDMIMPGGMTGLELAALLRETTPDLKVVISSGYNAELIDQDSAAANAVTYLQKPYRREVLSRTIRHCLDQPTTPPT